MDSNINKPKVSIIIPTYNRADLIKSAIESVLLQSLTDFELLILDDASTDNTEEVVRNYLKDERIQYIKHSSNLGITRNRNFGISKARGEYIAMLDSDDVWLSNEKLRKQVEFMDLHSEYGLIGTYSKLIDDEKKKKRGFAAISNLFLGQTDFWMREFFLIRNQLFQSSVLIRKKAIDELGTYNEKISIWEDYELWLRIGTRYKFYNISEFLTGYRIHVKNISNSSFEVGLEASFQILKLYKQKYPNYYFGYLKLLLKKALSIK